MEELIKRLNDKIQKTDTCWNWLGTLYRGYGSISIKNRNRGAHRVVYETLVGKVPDGLQLDHLCRNRKCVNPEHLEPVTRKENILRGMAPSAIASRRNHCAKGHLYTEDNLKLHFHKVKKSYYRICKKCIKLKNYGPYSKNKSSTSEKQKENKNEYNRKYNILNREKITIRKKEYKAKLKLGVNTY